MNMTNGWSQGISPCGGKTWLEVVDQYQGMKFDYDKIYLSPSCKYVPEIPFEPCEWFWNWFVIWNYDLELPFGLLKKCLIFFLNIDV